MLKRKSLAACVLALALLAVGIAYAQTTPRPPRPAIGDTPAETPYRGQKWEYMTIIGPLDKEQDALNAYGAEGWELIALRTEQGAGRYTITRYYFKRPKQGP